MPDQVRPHAVRPPRPGTGVTEDGRRLVELTSYQRRGSRLSSKQQNAWDRRSAEWLIPEGAVDEPGFELSHWFGRDAPLIVEVGSGNGEALAALAAARPEYDVLGFEVWRPGVATTFAHLERSGARNVRLLTVDAVWGLDHLLGAGALAELWTFFPDPWHKSRHHKRRLVSPSFAALVSSRLEVGGRWRLATDWAGYAEHISTVLDGESSLSGGPTERWAERPLTRFERKAVQENRPVVDFTYRRH
jgi:tRNA (guanine-N7-)-methyltransferase